MNLGFFPRFKGADTVLLSGSSSEIEKLIATLRAFGNSSEARLPIHDLALVSNQHPAQLFAIRRAADLRDDESPTYSWLCAPDVFDDVISRLGALTREPRGHHYFALVATNVRLVVSVGEYEESFWN